MCGDQLVATIHEYLITTWQGFMTSATSSNGIWQKVSLDDQQRSILTTRQQLTGEGYLENSTSGFSLHLRKSHWSQTFHLDTMEEVTIAEQLLLI